MRRTTSRAKSTACPPLIEDMIERGWLGEKTGSGFYKRVKKGGDSEILTLDWHTMEYRARQKAKFGSIEAGKAIEDTRERSARSSRPRLKGKPGTRPANFCGPASARRASTRRGASPKLPTRLSMWTAPCSGASAGNWARSKCGMRIGVERMAQALQREGKQMPPLVNKVLATPEKSFYASREGHALAISTSPPARTNLLPSAQESSF